MGLTLDPQLIRDLTVLITSSTVGGMVMEALRQPVINGYFIAGSVVGPGGLRLVKVRAKPDRVRLMQQEPLSHSGADRRSFHQGRDMSRNFLGGMHGLLIAV